MTAKSTGTTVVVKKIELGVLNPGQPTGCADSSVVSAASLGSLMRLPSTFTISATALILDARSAGLPGRNAFFANNFTMLFPGKSLVPGDKWTSLLELKVPGYQDSYVRVRDRVCFTGYRKQLDSWIAVLQSEFAGEIGGGFPIMTEVRANATKRTLLDQLSIDGAMEYIVDVQSGRVVSAQGIYRNNEMEQTMEFLAPNQAPVRKTAAESIGDEYYYTITLEYLSPETSANVDTLN